MELLAAVSKKTHLTSKTSTETYRARLWKKWNVFRNLCTVFIPGLLPVSASLYSQRHRETSPSPESVVPFPLDGRFPTKCAKRLPLALSTSLRKGKLSPTLSQAVTENRTGGVDLPSGCQSWHWRQRQQGAWVAVGDMIFSPAHPLGFPSTLLNQWHRSQAPRNS